LARLTEDVIRKDQEIVDLQRKILHVENEKSMEIRELKTRFQKRSKEYTELFNAHKELSVQLKSKERKIAALSIYALSTQRAKQSDLPISIVQHCPVIHVQENEETYFDPPTHETRSIVSPNPTEKPSSFMPRKINQSLTSEITLASQTEVAKKPDESKFGLVKRNILELSPKEAEGTQSRIRKTESPVPPPIKSKTPEPLHQQSSTYQKASSTTTKPPPAHQSSSIIIKSSPEPETRKSTTHKPNLFKPIDYSKPDPYTFTLPKETPKSFEVPTPMYDDTNDVLLIQESTPFINNESTPSNREETTSSTDETISTPTQQPHQHVQSNPELSKNSLPTATNLPKKILHKLDFLGSGHKMTSTGSFREPDPVSYHKSVSFDNPKSEFSESAVGSKSSIYKPSFLGGSSTRMAAKVDESFVSEASTCMPVIDSKDASSSYVPSFTSSEGLTRRKNIGDYRGDTGISVGAVGGHDAGDYEVADDFEVEFCIN